MRAVVEHDVLEIGRRLGAGDGQGAHVHDHRTVAVETVDLAVRPCQRDAEGNLRRVAHAAHRAKVVVVRLTGRLPQLEELA